MITFANPLGLLALLAIPVVLAIHFLQRKARQLPVSTLFLLERTQRDAASDRRIERLIPSIPLWMQLLAVLILTWFLTEPRFQKYHRIQRVAIVIDSSASMAVFKASAIGKLNEVIPSLQGSASALVLTVLEAAPTRPKLYSGSSLAELTAILGKWQPLDGLTDPSQALRLARSLVSREGTVIYLTDTPSPNLPFEVKQIAVGEAIENVGFTGVSFTTLEGTLVWRALVKNYGKLNAERSWLIQSSRGKSDARSIRLEPGALMTLQSTFPTDGKDVKVVLTEDRFALDDVLPMIAPQPKQLAIFTATSPPFEKLTQKLLRSLEATIPSNDPASCDLSLASFNPLKPILPPGNSIVFVEDRTRAGAYLRGGIVAVAHPFLDGLNWQALLIRETIELDQQASDTVLLWQDKRPLIFLREASGKRQLCFNFDLQHSNAENLPAFIVLLHRFAESIRERKITPSTENFETGQPVHITADTHLPLRLSATDVQGMPIPITANSKTAPLTPGFLTATQGESKLLDAAVVFADPREADFNECASSEEETTAQSSTLERHTKSDPLWRFGLLVLLAAMLVSWSFTSAKVFA